MPPAKAQKTEEKCTASPTAREGMRLLRQAPRKLYRQLRVHHIPMSVGGLAGPSSSHRVTVAASGRTLLSKRSSTSSHHPISNSRKISRFDKIGSLLGPSSASHRPIYASQCKAPQHLTTSTQLSINRARIRQI